MLALVTEPREVSADDATVTDFDEILASDLADPAYRVLHESAARDLDEEIARYRARTPLDGSRG